MNKRTVTHIWAVVLPLMAVFGAMGCLVSAFGLDPIGFGTALSWILAAVVFSLCYGRRMVLYPLGGLVLLGVFLWLRGYLSSSLSQLLGELTAVYDNAYGCGVLQWYEGSRESAGTGTALCWLGLPIVIATGFAVQRRAAVSVAVVLMALPLGCCMVVTDTVPSGLPLFVLLMAMLLLMMSQTVRRRDESQGNRLLALLVLPVAAGLALLFLLNPRQGYDRQEGAQRLEDTVVRWFQGEFTVPDLPQITQPPQLDVTLPQGGGSTAAPRQENLKNVGPKIQSDLRIMTVQADSDGVVYLRGIGYDRYSGTSWSAETDTDSWWPAGEAWERTGTVSISTAITHDVLYLPYYAGDGAYAALRGGKSHNTWRETDYSFPVGRIPAEQPTSEGYGADMEPYLQLPEQTRLWAGEIIRELFGTEQPPLTAQTANAIADYVRASASYDLKTSRMDGEYGDFAQWFLEKSDTGYCIHFASATAVLLRAAGIPSRYVTGYTVYAEAGEAVTVTGRNAHAWTEFRLPGCSWYPLESTPAYEEEPVPEQTFPQVTRPSVPQETQPTVPEPTETQPPAVREPAAPWRGWPWLLALGAVLAVVLQWRIRVGLRRARTGRGRGRQRALARWQQHVLMAKLLKQHPDKGLLELAQRAKFSQHAVTAEELAAFTGVLQEQTRALKKKPVYLQLYYTLILALY